MKIKNKLKTDNGFSLLEVLITIIIVSIGVFALASSQIRLLKRNDSTLIENAIGMQSNNMFEYMLANRTVIGEYLDTYDMSSGAVTTHGTAASVVEDTTAWTTALVNVGATEAIVTKDATINDVYHIVVTYQNNGAWGKSTTTSEVTYTANLSMIK